MNPADRVIAKFGGLSALARVLGHKHCTTVQGWRVAGRIPASQQPKLLAAAKASGIRLRPGDLVIRETDDVPQRPARRKRRA